MRKLVVQTKQLEFINAGWCMNDEATTDYNAIIDQMSIGLRFVEKNFGASARPRIGWHIDPFGHSAQMATIHALVSTIIHLYVTQYTYVAVWILCWISLGKRHGRIV